MKEVGKFVAKNVIGDQDSEISVQSLVWGLYIA